MGKAEKLSKVAQNRKAKMCTVRKTSPKGEDFTLFFATDSPFSQFHPCVFTVKDIKYNCAEQYMMHQKAGIKFLFIRLTQLRSTKNELLVMPSAFGRLINQGSRC